MFFSSFLEIVGVLSFLIESEMHWIWTSRTMTTMMKCEKKDKALKNLPIPISSVPSSASWLFCSTPMLKSLTHQEKNSKTPKVNCNKLTTKLNWMHSNKYTQMTSNHQRTTRTQNYPRNQMGTILDHRKNQGQIKQV